VVGLLLLLSDGVVVGDEVLDRDVEPVGDTDLVREGDPLTDDVQERVMLMVGVIDGVLEMEAVGVEDAPLLPVMLGVTLVLPLLLSLALPEALAVHDVLAVGDGDPVTLALAVADAVLVLDRVLDGVMLGDTVGEAVGLALDVPVDVPVPVDVLVAVLVLVPVPVAVVVLDGVMDTELVGVGLTGIAVALVVPGGHKYALLLQLPEHAADCSPCEAP
jgi:hypothetical protein